jgi:hypothetical protein
MELPAAMHGRLTSTKAARVSASEGIKYMAEGSIGELYWDKTFRHFS